MSKAMPAKEHAATRVTQFVGALTLGIVAAHTTATEVSFDQSAWVENDSTHLGNVRNIDDVYLNCNLSVEAAQYAESTRNMARPSLAPYNRAARR